VYAITYKKVICMYIYIYTHIHTYTHVYIYTCITAPVAQRLGHVTLGHEVYERKCKNKSDGTSSLIFKFSNKAKL
jgi:hypothetical protein